MRSDAHTEQNTEHAMTRSDGVHARLLYMPSMPLYTLIILPSVPSTPWYFLMPTQSVPGIYPGMSSCPYEEFQIHRGISDYHIVPGYILRAAGPHTGKKYTR